MEAIPYTLLEDYYEYRENKGVPLTKNSKEQVKYAVDDLNEFIADKYPTYTLRDLRQFHLKKLMGYLKNEKDLKESTVTTRFNQLRSFFLFCLENDLMEKDPLVGLETPMIPVTEGTCLTNEEWNKLITYIENSISNKNDEHRVARDLAIIQFLAYSACTLEEIASLTVEDIDLEKGIVNFEGSNKTHPRVIPIPNSIIYLLKQYKENHRAVYDRAKGKEPNIFFQASKATIQRGVREYSESALGRRITIEDVRASRINTLLRETFSVWGISEFLGIHDLTRLYRYIPSVKRELDSDIDKIKNMSQFLSSTRSYYLKSYHKRKLARNYRRI